MIPAQSTVSLNLHISTLSRLHLFNDGFKSKSSTTEYIHFSGCDLKQAVLTCILPVYLWVSQTCPCWVGVKLKCFDLDSVLNYANQRHDEHRWGGKTDFHFYYFPVTTYYSSIHFKQRAWTTSVEEPFTFSPPQKKASAYKGSQTKIQIFNQSHDLNQLQSRTVMVSMPGTRTVFCSLEMMLINCWEDATFTYEKSQGASEEEKHTSRLCFRCIQMEIQALVTASIHSYHTHKSQESSGRFPI